MDRRAHERVTAGFDAALVGAAGAGGPVVLVLNLSRGGLLFENVERHHVGDRLGLRLDHASMPSFDVEAEVVRVDERHGRYLVGVRFEALSENTEECVELLMELLLGAARRASPPGEPVPLLVSGRDGAEREARLLDVGLGGLALSLAAPAEVGEILNLRVMPGTGPSLEVRGRVVRSTPEPDGRSRAGVVLLGVSQLLAGKLEDFLRSRTSTQS